MNIENDSQDVADAPQAISEYPDEATRGAADISALPRLPVSASKIRWADPYGDEAAPVWASVSMDAGSVAPSPYNPPDSWDMYIADWRRVDQELRPAISLVPELINSGNSVGKAIQRYRDLFGELTEGRHLTKEYEVAAKMCAAAILSRTSERNCVSTSTKILQFLRGSVVSAHESGAYLYDRGAWASRGPDLPQSMIVDILNAFKLDGRWLADGPGSWGEFVDYFEEKAAACDIGDAGVDDAQTRQTHGWGRERPRPSEK